MFKNPFQGFLLKALFLYIFWLGLYYQFGTDKGGIEERMTEFVAESTLTMFHLLGYQTSGVWIDSQPDDEAIMMVKDPRDFVISIEGQETVSIANSCNSLLIIVLYAGFIVAYPGEWKPKVFFIVGGAILIFIINIFRIMALSFNKLYFPDTFEWNHKYTYTFVVYSLVFLLWMWWVNRYSYSKNSKLIASSK